MPEPTLAHLYSAWEAAPASCHGLQGRAVHDGTYRPHDVFGAVELVLTRAVVCSREVNDAALAATPRFADLPGEPVGNGEDIILSFAAMARTRAPNHAHRLPHENYPDPPGDGFTTSMVAAPEGIVIAR